MYALRGSYSHVRSVDCPGEVVPHPESMNHLTQAIHIIVLRHLSHEFNELVLKHQLVPRRREEDISGARPGHIEPERGAVAPREGQVTAGFLA